MLELEFTTHGRRWSAALAAPLHAGNFAGAVASGSSCNCRACTMPTHCHGTHTECVGHVTDNAVDLVRLTPVPPATCRSAPAGGATNGPCASRLDRSSTHPRGADGWQLGRPSILAMAPVVASLEHFATVGLAALVDTRLECGRDAARAAFHGLRARGIVPDWREPCVLPVAPAVP